MLGERVLPVVVSVVVIVLVAVIQERSRGLAAVLASMPLTAPLALWIVFTAADGDHRQAADFARALVLGFVAALAFVVVCWWGLSRGWSFPLVMLVGGAAWLVAILAPRLAPW